MSRNERLPSINWQDNALEILNKIKNEYHDDSQYFWYKVNESEDNAPHYDLVCPLATDFGSISQKLKENKYKNMNGFLKDSELVFINAKLYNPSSHFIHKKAMKLQEIFKELFNDFVLIYGKKYGLPKTVKIWQESTKQGPFAVVNP